MGGGRGVVLLALPAFLSSVISYSFIQNKGVGVPGLSPRSTAALYLLRNLNNPVCNVMNK